MSNTLEYGRPWLPPYCPPIDPPLGEIRSTEEIELDRRLEHRGWLLIAAGVGMMIGYALHAAVM